MFVSPLSLAEVLSVEITGAAVQGSLGFGINLVAAPLLELIEPRFVPVPLLLAGLASSALIAGRERGGWDKRGLGWALVGLLPGIGVGAAVVLVAPGPVLQASVAMVVLVAVALSLGGWRMGMSAGSLVGTGVVSGIMGTVAGLGGTPMGLHYQDAPGAQVRGTLARFSICSATLALAALALAGRVGRLQVELGALLVPGVVAGFVASSCLRRFLDRGGLRVGILALAGGSSVWVLVRLVA